MRALLPLLFCLFLSVPATAATHAGEPMPDFFVHTLDGRDLNLGDFAGKVVMVHFWATWCGACRTEMPALARFYRQHHREGLEVVAISLDEAGNRAQVEAAARVYGFTTALKDECQVDAFGRVWILPLTFVIDRHGVLRIADWTGKEHIDAARLDERLLPLLQE